VSKQKWELRKHGFISREFSMKKKVWHRSAKLLFIKWGSKTAFWFGIGEEKYNEIERKRKSVMASLHLSYDVLPHLSEAMSVVLFAVSGGFWDRRWAISSLVDWRGFQRGQKCSNHNGTGLWLSVRTNQQVPRWRCAAHRLWWKSQVTLEVQTKHSLLYIHSSK